MRKLVLFPLSMLFFLLLATSAQALTQVSSCQIISSPDTYVLTANITTNPVTHPVYCILINQTDNVILDLDGYSIIDGGGTDYGVFIQGEYNYSTDIVVRNGGLEGFFDAGIFASYVNAMLIEYMNIRLSGRGIHICGMTDLWSNETAWIQYNDITENQYGIYFGDCGATWNFNVTGNNLNNVIRDIYGDPARSHFVLNTIGFVNQTEDCCYEDNFYVWNNVFGGVTCIVPCTAGTASGAEVGVECIDCIETVWIQNVIYGDQDFALKGTFPSEDNFFFYNQFLRFGYQSLNGLFLDADTQNNYGCGNQGNIIDLGTNNTFLDSCPAEITGGVVCPEGWWCLDEDTLGYVLPDCHANTTVICDYGCVQNGTQSYCDTLYPEPPELPANATQPIPWVNQTEFEAMGLTWIIPLLTPLFLLSMISFVIAGVVEWFAKSKGVAFALVLIAEIMALMLLGHYPYWVGIAVIIIAGFILANWARSITG